MVFTSLPLYHLDPPNWNQPNQHQHQQTPTNECPHLISPPSMNTQSAHNPAPGSGSGNGSGSRPGSMVERARLAKIPQPEPALKCPRCDSTNTKFCYFNNYSLSQPRHFCKTCRRYWTRGGALRNVPVGGGCRRNKRSGNKSSTNSNNSKSGASSAAAAASSSSSCSTATSGSTVIPSNFATPHHHHQLPFLSSLHPLADQYGATLGLNFTAMQQQQHLDAGDYQMDPGSGGSSLGLDQWRIQQIQQFPFLGGLDHTSSAAAMAANPVAGIYPNFEGDGAGSGGGEGFHVPSKVASSTTSGLITQLAAVKMEDSHHNGLSLPRQYLGIPGNDQYLGGGWASDISGFNPSSSGNIL